MPERLGAQKGRPTSQSDDPTSDLDVADESREMF